MGHTDTTAEPDTNDLLSLEVADAVAAYLRDEAEKWLGRYDPSKPYEKRWGSKEDHFMIQAMPDYATKPPGEPAVWWYQRTRGLEVDGAAGDETRRALVREYMALSGEPLPRAVGLATHGCGESFPIAPEGLGPDDPGKEQNRRVEVYFFDRDMGIQPPALGPISRPGSAEYPEWVRRARETHDYPLTRGERLVVRLHDERSRPMGGVFARAMVAGRSEQILQADAQGWIDVDLGPMCPDFVDIEWGAALPAGLFPLRRRTIPECQRGAQPQLVRARLHNIGYPLDLPLEIAVKCFQTDYGVDQEPEPRGLINGQLPDATRQRLDAIYTRDCDATPSGGPLEG